jgi:glycosyltransferase involved in cell wall biosynthesis
MVTMATLAVPTGYGTRTALALRSVRAVQAGGGAAPVLLAFESLRDWLRPKRWRSIRALAQAAGAILVCVPSVPKSLPFSTHLNAAWGACVARWVGARYRVGVAHGQSHMASGVVARAFRDDRGRKIVFDAHGVDIEEAVADGRLPEGSGAHRLRLALERLALRRSDWVLPVTSSLAAHLRARATPLGQVRIVPCVSSLPMPQEGVELARRASRGRLGWGDDPVVAYVGSASAWQDPRRLVAAFCAARQHAPSLRFLVVTPDVAVFRGLLERASLPPDAYCVGSYPHAEVAAITAAADVGLLLRDDSLINRVASPTKFAEYLSVGVPVVLTDVLVDCAAVAQDADVGRVLPAAATSERVAAALLDLACAPELIRTARRARAQTAVRQALSFESILPTYAAIYATPGAMPSESQ